MSVNITELLWAMMNLVILMLFIAVPVWVIRKIVTIQKELKEIKDKINKG